MTKEDDTDDDEDNIQVERDKFVSSSGEKWFLNPPAHQGRPRMENILRQPGGATRYAIQRIHTSLQ